VLSLRSKVKLESELELSRGVGGLRDRPEVGSLQACDRNGPNRGIRQIERLEAEFQSESFCDRELSENRKIQILVPVRAK
jgi:hypothetical protein